MSYCINPTCHNRQNIQSAKYCVTCGTSLFLYGDRFRIIEKISTSHQSHDWEVFRVTDAKEISDNNYKVLKTLKNNSLFHKELFNREKAVLRNLRHPGIPAYIIDFPLPAEEDRPELDCLIMECVEGQDLSKWVKSNKLHDKEIALQWLRKIASILSYIHNKKYFHRDIKPGNIMLKDNGELSLIDYGIVREITDTVYERGASTKAYTPAYAAPEQRKGAAVPQSDFYALGRTFVHLLTGISPDSERLDASTWEKRTGFPTSGIIPLIKWMLKEDPAQRPETAQRIIEVIDYITTRKPDGTFPTMKDTENKINLTRRNWRLNLTVFRKLKAFKVFELRLLPIFLIGITISIVLIIQPFQPKLEAVCNSVLYDEISCGEQILLKTTSQGSSENKKRGAQFIANGDYHEAIKLLTKDWEERKDPETLIMLENAKLEGKDSLIRSIAVSIPAFTPPAPVAILKGVSFAQKNWNEEDHQWKIRLVIVNDENNKEKAVELMKTLLKREIYAGIGSYSSDVTLPIKDIYQKERTVLVSGSSSVSKLKNDNPGTFFFRLCSSSEKLTEKIADYLRKKEYTKVALFHTSGEPFSDSMTNELKKDIGERSIIKEFNFKGATPAINEIEEAKKLGAQAIVLFPGAYTSEDPERNRSLSLIRENNGKLPIIGNEMLKDPTVLTLGKKLLQKLVITSMWHPPILNSNKIKPPSYWGDLKQLDDQIALNYDVIQTIIKALDQLPIDKKENIFDSRRKIQKILSDSAFQMNGYTGKISFIGSERKKTIGGLLKPLCNNSDKCEGYEAIP
jgi:eukaryotic-like serine/threonine-protein kinase